MPDGGVSSYRNHRGPKTAALAILLFFWSIYTSGQVIRGIVLDSETKKPVSYAYLYFSGTFTGTQSDQNGNFEIDVTRNSSIPLTVSAVGYYSTTIPYFKSQKPAVIFLQQKVYPINEITVTARSLAKKRRTNLFIFRNIFLGTTRNAHLCHILNENDISFNYDSDKDTLKAYALKPLLIENKALGYTITYYLDKFEYYRKEISFRFNGTIIFIEDLTADSLHKDDYERKRQKAYLGSRMHFFRALWLDDLKSAGFTLKDVDGEVLDYKDIVSDESVKEKYLFFRKNIQICYKSSIPSSQIDFLKEKVSFSNDGYFDASGIMWEGSMAALRMADWLPYEYSVK